ncbi:MAG: hydroxyacid dehydrogenase [Candidatus Bathyarchaeota archaeon]|nr:hydroxyacid dehydrogenase [Candidatus Bathyarchaeota archaeon]
MSKPKILFLPASNSWRGSWLNVRRVFNEELLDRMKEIFDVTMNPSDKNYDTNEVVGLVKGFDGVVTSWGCPSLTSEVFEKADSLKIIAHAAGTLRSILSKDIVEKYVIPRNICVFSARRAIGLNVAEFTVGIMIAAKRRVVEHVLAFREKGVWKDPDISTNNEFLRGSIVGIVGASHVGREVIRLLKPFDVEILVYDPYLSDWEAGHLGVEKVSLEELFRRSDFVSVHAPLTEETHHLIDERHLKLMRDGTVLVNTSRGTVIDHEALLKECETQRILAALDVTEPEPLPPDSPFRKLRNVIVTPHIAGKGRYGRLKQGASTLKALEDLLLLHRMPEGAVDLKKWDIIA